MIIYCDGGYLEHGSKKNIKRVVSWGIKIVDGDNDVELMGARDVNQRHTNLHEVIALIEGVIYAITHNGNTLNTTIVTDYDQLAAGTSHDYTFDPSSNYRLRPCIERLVDRAADLYSPEIIRQVKQFLIFGKIRWQRGHTHECVNHNRADYLATKARAIHLGHGAKKVRVEAFGKWLSSISTAYSGRQKYIPTFATMELA